MVNKWSMNKNIPPELDAIAKTVLSYRPPEKEKATRQREKRKKRAKKSPKLAAKG